MDIRFPGLELREPLYAHPVSGSLYGAITGAVFGLLAQGGEFGVSSDAVLAGYTLGGLSAGLLVGAALPLFRNRIVAGVVVSIAAGVALWVAGSWWEQRMTLPATLVVGLMVGILYAGLFWDYQPGPTNEEG